MIYFSIYDTVNVKCRLCGQIYYWKGRTTSAIRNHYHSFPYHSLYIKPVSYNIKIIYLFVKYIPQTFPWFLTNSNANPIVEKYANIREWECDTTITCIDLFTALMLCPLTFWLSICVQNFANRCNYWQNPFLWCLTGNLFNCINENGYNIRYIDIFNASMYTTRKYFIMTFFNIVSC